MFESTQIIGEKQYSKAKVPSYYNTYSYILDNNYFSLKELFDAATVQVTGPVQFRHTFKDFTKISFMHKGRKVSYKTSFFLSSLPLSLHMFLHR